MTGAANMLPRDTGVARMSWPHRGGRYPAGHRAVSSTVERHATEQPEDEDDDQHEAENATDTRSAVAAIAIVAAPAAEQQDQQRR